MTTGQTPPLSGLLTEHGIPFVDTSGDWLVAPTKPCEDCPSEVYVVKLGPDGWIQPKQLAAVMELVAGTLEGLAEDRRFEKEVTGE